MKKPSSKIREEIARLQEQLQQAETREAERIGRVALKAGLGEIEEINLQTTFKEIAARFRGGQSRTTGRKNAGGGTSDSAKTATRETGASAGGGSEA